MVYSAENEYFTLGVKQYGAELTSLKSKKSGREYIWCGNTDIWYGQAPILFPFIGRLLDDKYRYNGKEYTCPKHGVARKRDFELIESSSDSLTFMQTDDEGTRSAYPFGYRLIVRFKLNGNSLEVTHRVENTNDTTMYFSIGAHPGFACEIGDVLEFPNNQTLSMEQIDADSILVDKKIPLLNNEKQIRLTPTLFDNDALILSGYTDKELTLRGNGYSVRFCYYDAPYMGIWAKPNAPYVCLEPWYGINDNRDFKNDISEKRGIIALDAGKAFDFKWVAVCE